MRREIITDTHRQWIKENLNLTFEDIESMTEAESNALCSKLLNLECDALEDDSDDLELVCEILDIIYDEKPELDEDEV